MNKFVNDDVQHENKLGFEGYSIDDSSNNNHQL